jgi:hypothetical protein
LREPNLDQPNAYPSWSVRRRSSKLNAELHGKSGLRMPCRYLELAKTIDPARLPMCAWIRRTLQLAIILFATAGLMLSANAQKTELRDPSGNLLGYTQWEGNRTVLRDKAGNPHGSWQQEGSWLVHRDNAGNLLDRQQMK